MNEVQNVPTSMSLSLVRGEDDKLAEKKREGLEPESENLENMPP